MSDEPQTEVVKKRGPRKEAPPTPEPVVREVATKKYRVTCHPPTPLAQTQAVFEANNPDEAKQKFFNLNGITATVHTVDIVEV